ncbi:hypothetical protein EII17_12825 [Clostridiales bacterium COT073_COT-073]|nr:hypothetical protein EII17_12825 [Clostridiales bacterium COT073_COT-073]
MKKIMALFLMLVLSLVACNQKMEQQKEAQKIRQRGEIVEFGDSQLKERFLVKLKGQLNIEDEEILGIDTMLQNTLGVKNIPKNETEIRTKDFMAVRALNFYEDLSDTKWLNYLNNVNYVFFFNRTGKLSEEFVNKVLAELPKDKLSEVYFHQVGYDPEALSPFTELETLGVETEKFEFISPKLPKLKSLFVQANVVEDLSGIQKIEKLDLLQLSGAKTGKRLEVDLAALPENIESLNIRNADLKNQEKLQNMALNTLYLDNIPLKNSDLKYMNAWLNIHLSGNGITEIAGLPTDSHAVLLIENNDIRDWEQLKDHHLILDIIIRFTKAEKMQADFLQEHAAKLKELKNLQKIAIFLEEADPEKVKELEKELKSALPKTEITIINEND